FLVYAPPSPAQARRRPAGPTRLPPFREFRLYGPTIPRKWEAALPRALPRALQAGAADREAHLGQRALLGARHTPALQRFGDAIEQLGLGFLARTDPGSDDASAAVHVCSDHERSRP